MIQQTHLVILFGRFASEYFDYLQAGEFPPGQSDSDDYRLHLYKKSFYNLANPRGRCRAYREMMSLLYKIKEAWAGPVAEVLGFASA